MVLAILFIGTLIWGYLLLERFRLSDWIWTAWFLIYSAIIAYSIRNAMRSFVDFQEAGIEYRNPDKRAKTFIPKEEIRSIDINGLILNIQTEAEHHRIQLGTMKYAEVEALRENLTHYRPG
jgi:hypothetical protein